MTYLPVILFAIAAVGGLTLVYLKFSGQMIPMSLAVIHGLFAAAGLIALMVNVYMNTEITMMNISLALFIIVAIGCFIIFSFYVRKKELPQCVDCDTWIRRSHFLRIAVDCGIRIASYLDMCLQLWFPWIITIKIGKTD